jgi:hypothetical protein
MLAIVIVHSTRTLPHRASQRNTRCGRVVNASASSP